MLCFKNILLVNNYNLLNSHIHYKLSGVSIWNYNASPEMSYAGVRLAKIYLNGKALDSLILLRKAPGEYFGAISRVRSRFLNDKSSWELNLIDFKRDFLATK